MPNPSDIPKTFCPAKWDELIINYQHNYVYSCCKAKPMIFVNDYKNIIEQQRQNLLHGIQDSSCNYCWAVENNNKPSLRDYHLSIFDESKFTEYLDVTRTAKRLEINLGNTCDMQCIYCNPKFSSQWENDVKEKKYPLFTDRFVYDITPKENIKLTMESNVEILQHEKSSHVTLMGGEPLQNKYFWKIASGLKSTHLAVPTNLNCDLSTVKKLLDLESNNDLHLELMVSIDCTYPLVEFNRYGLDYKRFLENLFYFLRHTKSNQLTINSLMTSITILDIKNFIEFLRSLQIKFPNKTFMFHFHACTTPKIQSFATIPDHTRQNIITFLKEYKDKKQLLGIENIISYLESAEFNIGLHKQFKIFISEWESRKQIILDKQYKELLCL